MKGTRAGLLLLCLVLAMPLAAAYHLSSFPNPGPDEVIDLRQRVLATRTVNLDDAPAGNLLTYTFPWDPEYSYNDRGHVIRVHLSYTATFPSLANGAWEIGVAKEITGNLDSCTVRVETVNPVGITLDAIPVYAHYSWDCLFTASQKVHYHNHTIYVNRTVASGSPSAMTAESISVKLETEDLVIIPNTHKEVLEHRENTLEILGMDFDGISFAAYLLTVTWGFVLVWALRARPRPYILVAAGATVGAVLVFLEVPYVGQVAAIFLTFVAFHLEGIVGEKVYVRLFKPDDDTDNTPKET